MSWLIESTVTKKDEDGKITQIPSVCEVGLVDGIWYLNTKFDREVIIPEGTALQIAYHLNKP